MIYTPNHNPDYYKLNPSMTNCGSYAFNIEEWYDPDLDEEWDEIEDWVDDFLERGYELEEIPDLIANEYVEQILSDFYEEVRLIDNEHGGAPNEEVIAFRIYIDLEDYWGFDFHFKVFRDGYWREKCGSQDVTPCDLEEWGRYNSSTFFFAKKII